MSAFIVAAQAAAARVFADATHAAYAAAALLRTNSSILWKALYCIATLPKAMLSTYFSVLPRLSPMTWMARHLLRRRILASKLVVLNMQLRSLTARVAASAKAAGTRRYTRTRLSQEWAQRRTPLLFREAFKAGTYFDGSLVLLSHYFSACRLSLFCALKSCF